MVWENFIFSTVVVSQQNFLNTENFKANVINTRKCHILIKIKGKKSYFPTGE